MCSPEIYNSEVMQNYVRQRREDKDKQWIYKLIEGNWSGDELVYVDQDDFMLCRDIHPGTDQRYLVVFKDLTLQTIRDLRQTHVDLLETVTEKVNVFLREHHRDNCQDYRIFFHYTPSVFQLHAHVSIPGQHNQSTRIHPISSLIRNLRKSSLWYHNALILISLCRSMKGLNLYRPIR